MKNLKVELENRIELKEGYYEAIVNFDDVEDRDAFEEKVEQLGYEIFFDTNDGDFYTITKQDI